MISAVKESIDPLEVTKDPLSYTFASSLTAAIDEYFGALRREKDANDESDENADEKEAKAEIFRIIERIRHSFEIEISKQRDEEEKTVALIDYLKEKASGVAYKVTRGMAKRKAIKLLKEVGIPDPARRYKQYPFEFSGGMRQRIVIAIALSADPDILICDEPTTALDVTIQSQILELINKVKKERDLSVIFITHNLGVVANMADRVAVMYAGKIVEIGTADDVFYSPAHPYTWALLSSMPDLDTKEALEAIPGTPPNMIHPPKGDAFAERNRYALKIDFEEQPPMFRVSDTHFAATWLLHPDAPKVEPPKSVTEKIERMEARRSTYENTAAAQS
ncbi:MAG TPA: peptide ABC transporter ATP-binding protein [Clostridiales bacterium]|nr:peptide ABC transporter ATP-binding protein [Clostridiales bacterium]